MNVHEFFLMICFKFLCRTKKEYTYCTIYECLYSIAIVLYKNEMTMKIHMIYRQEIHQNRRTQLLNYFEAKF